MYGYTARMYGYSEQLNSLARLICSRARAEMFRVLFGIKAGELHLHAIHRKTGFALGMVRQDIGKLVKLGLLTRRRDGNRIYHAAKGRNPLYAEIRLLVLKTAGLVDVLARQLSVPRLPRLWSQIRDQFPRQDKPIRDCSLSN